MHRDDLKRYDLNLLFVFEAVYEQGNLTRAANKLNLTQSAVSHALKRLRTTFDDPLFLRRGSRMLPTPLSRTMIDPVKKSIASMLALAHHSEVFDPVQANRLITIGFQRFLESAFLPPLAKDLKSRAPGLHLSAFNVTRRNLETDLIEGQFDLAVDVSVPVSDSIKRRKLFTAEHVLIVRENHPLCAGPFELDEYLKYGHVHVSARKHGPAFVDLALAKHKCQRNIELRCQDNFAAFKIASETDLLLTTIRNHIAIFESNIPFKVLPMPMEIAGLEICLYFHKNAERDPGILWVAERMEEIYGLL
ncbi:MAG: LysR family transcriptional regulator [Rhodobacter sp.]|nr:LysR family transcriptional regulator [Rhodobacter sp.]